MDDCAGKTNNMRNLIRPLSFVFLCALTLMGCISLGNSRTTTIATVAPGGSIALTDMNCDLYVENDGPGELEVTVRSQTGDVLIEKTLAPQTSCTVFAGKGETFRAANSSKSNTGFRVKRMPHGNEGDQGR